jgi:hypothetical protein
MLRLFKGYEILELQKLNPITLILKNSAKLKIRKPDFRFQYKPIKIPTFAACFSFFVKMTVLSI